MKTIASRQNPIVRAYRALADRPDPYGTRLLLDGAHLVREAAAAGFAFEEVCIAASHLDRGTEEAALASELERRGIEVAAVPDTLLTAISPVRTPSGIVAIATRRSPIPTPADILGDPSALVLVGVDIQDPGNVGALLRVAEAAGAHGALLAGDSASPWSWKALRGSMGSALRLPVADAMQPDETLRTLRQHQVRTVAAVRGGGADPDRIAWTGRVAIVVGSEGNGLDAGLVAQCDTRVTIPMAAAVESLNVTVAAAILLYAARRARTPTDTRTTT